MVRRLVQLLAGAILSASLVMAAAPAHAAEVVQPDGTVCATNKAKKVDDNYLPLARWGDATNTFHMRLNWTNVDQKVVRGGPFEFIMQSSNFLLGATLGLTKVAGSYCPLDTFGYELDKSAATIGEMLLSSSLLTLGVVIAVLAAVMRSLRGGMGSAVGKTLMSKAAIVALFVAMLAGARGTTDDGNFGTLSPGWFANGIEAATAAVAGAPALAIHKGVLSVTDLVSGDTGKCGEMTRALDQLYAETGGGQAGSPATLTPRILSGVWQQSGLRAWKQVQFGDAQISEDGKSPGDWTACFYSEMKSSVAPTNRVAVLNAIALPLPGKTVEEQAANLAGNPLFRPGDDTAEDIALVGWAACNPSTSWAMNPHASLMINGGLRNQGTVRDGEVKGGAASAVSKAQAAAVCKAVFGDLAHPPRFSAWGEQAEHTDTPGASWLDWGDDEPGIIAATSSGTAVDQSAQDFLLTLHGNNKDGLTPVLAYLFSAASIFAVFGGLALGVIIAKTASLAAIATIFFVLLAALFGKGVEAAGRFAKRFVGVNLFAAGATALLAVVSLLTGVIAGFGSMFPPFIGILWVGLSPLAAVYLCHKLVTKTLHMASPFTPSGAMGYATSLSKGGYANAMGGFGQMSQPGFLGRTASNFGGSELSERFNPFGQRKDAPADAATSAAGKGRYGQGGPKELKPGTPGAAQAGVEEHKERLREQIRTGNRAERDEARDQLRQFRKTEASAAQDRSRQTRGSWAERAGASFAAAPVRNTLKAAAVAGAATISFPAVATAAVGYGAYRGAQKVARTTKDGLAVKHGYGSGSRELQAAINELWADQDRAEAAKTARPAPDPYARVSWE